MEMEKKMESRNKSIKLYCPTVSKLEQIVAWDDQKLDLGTIARIFGIEPSTLKLNGHFISRGVDFVASSVTWKSLLSFFSSRGLSTGTHGSGALIVDGKLTKSGTKRSHEPAEIDRRAHCRSEVTGVGENLRHEVSDSPNYKKLKDNNNVSDKCSETVKCNEGGLKRKHWLENIGPFKRLRLGNFLKEGDGGGNRSSSFSKLPCGFSQRETMKRTREDEMLGTCKRTRSTITL